MPLLAGRPRGTAGPAYGTPGEPGLVAFALPAAPPGPPVVFAAVPLAAGATPSLAGATGPVLLTLVLVRL